MCICVCVCVVFTLKTVPLSFSQYLLVSVLLIQPINGRFPWSQANYPNKVLYEGKSWYTHNRYTKEKSDRIKRRNKKDPEISHKL